MNIKLLLANFYNSSRKECGNVDLKVFFSALNWRETPVTFPKQIQDDNHKIDEKKIFESTTLERQQLKINYPNLIAELNQ
jgi:hypothetical protein